MLSNGDVARRAPAEPHRRPGKYGIDGGDIVVPVFVVVQSGLAIAMWWALRRGRRAIAGLAGLASLAAAGIGAGYLYSSGEGKLRTWGELLDELQLSGNERVLDVGCGRGAVLILAAHRVPGGEAVGMDLWRRRDQSGNSHAATERNATLEGISDRVSVVDADARDMPFPSASFDVVVSNLVFHNIRSTEGRNEALSEAVRVLRDGGKLRIVDEGADRYPDVLRNLGCVDIVTRRLDWRTWYGFPGNHQTMVSATKPI
jgi:cyclopropane fatty-acyl-phospholipid synthase-like methyltransferase